MTTTASKYLRGRVFSETDWATYYGPAEKLHPVVEEILMSPCLFHKGKLVMETHFAFIGRPTIYTDPLTVEKWIEIHPRNGQPRFYFDKDTSWHIGQPHTEVATLESRLYIVLRDIVPNSTYRTPKEQVAMLPPEYEVSTTIAEVRKNILFRRRTGKLCNSSRWAACSERTVQTALADAGKVSSVGRFNKDGLVVGRWDGYPDGLVGVSASRIIKLS